MMTNSKRK